MTVLQKRFLFGTAILAAFFGIIFLDYIFDSAIGLGFLGILVGGIGLWEFYNLAEKKDFEPFKISGVISGVIVFIGFWLSACGEGINRIYPGIFVFIVLWLFGVQALKHDPKGTIKNVSITIFGVIYTLFFLSFIMPIRYMSNGLGIILLVLLITKGGDIGAYLFGRKFGKHKLSSFSPNKTIEGALFGLLIGVSGMCGDLMESVMKRDADAKDASSAIPAFGGVLDILDSLLISIPVAYCFLVIIGY